MRSGCLFCAEIRPTPHELLRWFGGFGQETKDPAIYQFGLNDRQIVAGARDNLGLYLRRYSIKACDRVRRRV